MASRPPTFDHLSKKKPVEEKVMIGLDDDTSVTFVFRSIGRKAWRDLKDAHPATDEQKAQVRAELGEGAEPEWNVESFPPAAVSACCVEPAMTLEQANELFESPDWNEAELSALLIGAISVNARTRVAETGKGSGPTPSSASG